jgi:lipopolysaccharide exporter
MFSKEATGASGADEGREGVDDGDVGAETLREKTFEGVRWLSVTRAIAEVGSVAAAVVLARLVPPADFGRLAVAIVVNELALAVANESIGIPLVQRKQLERGHFEAAAFLGLVVGVSLTLATLLLMPLVTTPLFGSATTSFFQLFSPAFALAGVMIVPLAKLQRELRFRRIGAVEVVGVLVSCVLSVLLAYDGLGAKSYIIGALAGLAISAVGYMIGQSPTLPRWRPRHMRELVRFGAPAASAGLAGIGYRNVDYLLLGVRMSPLNVGFYYRAFTVGVEYERRLSGIVARIAFPVYARAQDADHMRRLRQRIVRVNVTATYPMLALFIALAPVAVPWLFGERWEPAVLPAQILAVAGMASTVRSGTSPVVLAAGRPRALFVFSLAEMLAYGATVWVAAAYGLTTVCIAVSVFQVIALTLAYLLLVKPAAGVGPLELVRDIGPALVSCVALLAVTVPLDHLIGPSFPALAQLLVAGPAGLLAYGLTLRLLFPAAWSDVALLVRRVLPERWLRGRGTLPRVASALVGERA